MKFIQSKTVHESGASLFYIVIDDQYAFISGVVAADFAEGQAVLGDISKETTAVMHAISNMLGEVDLSMGDIVRTDIHLTNLANFEAFDEAYRKFFALNRYPARTTTVSPQLIGGSLVEITCMARLRKES